MDIEIRKLTPNLAEDYVRFFDETPHDDNVDEHKCYCVCWCAGDSDGVDVLMREKRRALAAEYVREGILQGYLAYRDGEIVGWCNANTKSECLKCYSWRTYMSAVPTEDSKDVKVKSVFCFTIAPEMRRQGVATRLLERVIEDAVRDRFDFIEAYPYKNFTDELGFAGSAEMYKKLGFVLFHETEQNFVMRKVLK